MFSSSRTGCTGKALDMALAYALGGGARAEFLKQHSEQKQRQTYSENRQYFAVVFVH